MNSREQLVQRQLWNQFTIFYQELNEDDRETVNGFLLIKKMITNQKELNGKELLSEEFLKRIPDRRLRFANSVMKQMLHTIHPDDCTTLEDFDNYLEYAKTRVRGSYNALVGNKILGYIFSVNSLILALDNNTFIGFQGNPGDSFGKVSHGMMPINELQKHITHKNLALLDVYSSRAKQVYTELCSKLDDQLVDEIIDID